jgi:hypothetical protein
VTDGAAALTRGRLCVLLGGLAILAHSAFGQSPIAIQVAGVEVSLGMPKASALGRFGARHNVVVKTADGATEKEENDVVVVYGDSTMRIAGTLTFDSGVLRRIAVTDLWSGTTEASDVIRAIYSAVAAAPKSELVSLQTSWNENASRPEYTIDIKFKDREIVILSSTPDSPNSRSYVQYPASVTTFYPSK